MHPRNGIITALKRFHSTFFLPMNEWLENMEAPRRDMVVRCLTAGSFKVPQVPQQQCASKEANLNDAQWSLCYCYTLAWLSDSCRMRHISNTPQLKIQKRIQSKEETVGKTINLSRYFVSVIVLSQVLVLSVGLPVLGVGTAWRIAERPGSALVSCCTAVLQVTRQARPFRHIVC